MPSLNKPARVRNRVPAELGTEDEGLPFERMIHRAHENLNKRDYSPEAWNFLAENVVIESDMFLSTKPGGASLNLDEWLNHIQAFAQGYPDFSLTILDIGEAIFKEKTTAAIVFYNGEVIGLYPGVARRTVCSVAFQLIGEEWKIIKYTNLTGMEAAGMPT